MRPEKILLVDDEEIVRSSLAREIRLKKYSVTTVADGNEAIGTLRSNRYDLVITDLAMPGIDGMGVLESVKTGAPETAVILLTGRGDMDTVIEALRLGADDFLRKPCDIEELLFRVDRCLEKQSLLQQLSRKNQKLRKTEEVLQQAQADLEYKVRERTEELEQTNIALKVLLKQREQDNTVQEQQITANMSNLVEPYLLQLTKSRLSDQQQMLVDILSANLRELTSPFASKLSSKLTRLTPAEIQVANLVRQGKQSKEIGTLLHLSPGTINIHRKNIRKKLGLTHKKTNLQSMLSAYI